MESGHVAVRGIGFDDRKSTITSSSERSVDAIAQLLARDPRRKLMIVVHSDGTGDVRTAVTKTRKQAALLVSTLVKKHKVPANRILGEGVGPLAPVAPNTPEGSALNRRVEVVLQAVPVSSGLKASQTDK
jgi:OOP family OmpA-OmpF porin